jgi:hypothetical protein
MRASVVLGGIALLVLAVTRAEASPSAKLVYARGSGAETCPPETDLRSAVAVRLGYDPFFSAAQKVVVAQVSRVPKGYRGHVQIVGDDGNVRGERELATKGDDCAELISAIALAISLALDDLDEPAPSDPPEPPPHEPSPAASGAPAIKPPTPSEPPFRDARPIAPAKPHEPPADLTLSVGPTVTIGMAPDAAAGADAALALRWPRIALRFDLRKDLPASKAIQGGSMATHAGLATASICLRFGAPFACAGGGTGSLWTRTDGIARPASDRAVLLVASLRFGVQFGLGTRLYLEPAVELGANLAHPVVQVDGRSVYELSPVWGAFGMQLGFKIF